MNLLSISIDDLNSFATFKELYPGSLHTPNIDALAATSITFRNAFAQVALCNPSRSSILTGQYPAETGIHDNATHWYDVLDPAETLPAILKDAGYYTSIVGKVFHTKLSAANANDSEHAPEDVVNVIVNEDVWNANGWNGNSVDNPFRTGAYAGSVEEHGDFVNAEYVADFLSNYDGTSPFAMFVGFYKPHMDWVVPQEYFDLYPLDEIELPFVLDGDLSDVPEFMRDLVNDSFHAKIIDLDFWKSALQGYFASISFADAMVGKVLDALAANDLASDTAIVLWSDHGYHLGDKDNWHKFTLWDEAGRAPLIVSLPDMAHAGQTVDQVVEMVDLFPTVLDLLGVTGGSASGESLTPFLENPMLTTDGHAITTMYGSASIRTNDFRYTRYEDGSEELYAVALDPNETQNLAEDLTYSAVKSDLLDELSTALDGWVFVTEGTAEGNDDTSNIFVASEAVASLTGGMQADTYFISSSATAIAEPLNGGMDTVYVTGDFVLPDNVENLLLKTGYGRSHVLVGNASNNSIQGGDTLYGLDGDDSLSLIIAGLADGGRGNDRLDGSSGSDILIGDEGNDVIFAAGGDDWIVGGTGSDYLNGNAGFDVIDYSAATGAVTVDLRAKQVIESDGNIDQLVSIEGAMGTSGADTFVGDAGNNKFWIGLGDDHVLGDIGTDTVVFSGDMIDFAPTAYSATDGNIAFSYAAAGGNHTVAIDGVEIFEFGSGERLTYGEFVLLLEDRIEQPASTDPSDFDGDGGTDLLFRNSENEAVYVIDGSGNGFQKGFGVQPGVNVLPTIDLNGNGTADLLFSRTDGVLSSKDGGSGELVASYGNRSGQRLIGVADFDNDGGADLLLLRESDNATFVINGEGGFQSGFGSLPSNEVFLPGDLNADGIPDLLIRKPDGSMYSRDGNSGETIAGYGNRSDQTLLGASDFDGDGDFDLLFQKHDSGSVFIIDGSGEGFQKGFGSLVASTIVLAGDLDGNGSADLIIGRPDGFMYSLDGASGNRITSYGNRADQQLFSVADFDNDGGNDLLFRSLIDDRVFILNGEGGFQKGFGTQTDVTLHVLGDLNSNDSIDLIMEQTDGFLSSKDGASGDTITGYGDRNGEMIISNPLVPQGIWNAPITDPLVARSSQSAYATDKTILSTPLMQNEPPPSEYQPRNPASTLSIDELKPANELTSSTTSAPLCNPLVSDDPLLGSTEISTLLSNSDSDLAIPAYLGAIVANDLIDGSTGDLFQEQYQGKPSQHLEPTTCSLSSAYSKVFSDSLQSAELELLKSHLDDPLS